MTAFFSAPAPSILITLPFPNLSCLTLYPTFRVWSRLVLSIDDLELISESDRRFLGVSGLRFSPPWKVGVSLVPIEPFSERPPIRFELYGFSKVM